MYNAPKESAAKPAGNDNLAVAMRPSVEELVPFPANVPTTPDDTLTVRMRWFA